MNIISFSKDVDRTDSSKDFKEYVVIDTETTGLGNTDKIIEVAAVKVKDGIVTESFNHLVNPEMSISSEASKVSGITDEMVISKPKISEIENQFMQFIGDSILIGHNITFDLRFLRSEISKPINNKYFDTMKLSKKYFSNVSNYKLITLASYFNVHCRV